MFTTLLSELSGYFDRNWVLSIFFPSLTFWSACLFVIAFVNGLGQSVQLWQSWSLEIQIVFVAGTLAWIILFAFLLGNFQTAIIRLFEGYWSKWPLSVLRDYRQQYYRRRYRYLRARLKSFNTTVQPRSREARIETGNENERQAALEETKMVRDFERESLLFLPSHEVEVMPTRLGNIIRAAELYAFTRYGIDSVVIWPRLHALMPPEFIKSLVDAKTSMVFMLMMSLLSFAFTVVVCVPLAILTSRSGLFFICALGIPLAWLCYENALHGASAYGEMIKTAFDLHRWKLLEALHLKLPTSYSDETDIWDDVNKLIYRSAPFATASYEQVHPPQTKETNWTDVVNQIATFFEDKSPNEETPGAPLNASGGGVNARPMPPLNAAPVVVVKSETSSDRDSPRSFFVASSVILYVMLVGSVTVWLYRRPLPQVSIPVASHDLPSYHLLSDDDLVSTQLPTEAVQSGALTDKSLIVKSYTLEAIPKDSVINPEKIRSLTTPATLSASTSVSLPATPAMVLGGSLKSGDVVDVTLVSKPASSSTESTEAPRPPSLITFQNVLVLDVKSVPVAPQAAITETHPFILIIAIPSNRREELLQNVDNANVFLTRHP